jgi:dephospho-CoA kinase
MGDKIPFQLGITGGIGSGKSVFARIFSVMGVPVYESDQETKKLYLRTDIRKQVISLLGEGSYRPDGFPDTGFIADKIYREPGLRNALNAILHPAVALQYRQWLEEQNHPFVLKVAALLFEADIARQLDFTALVISPASLRKERLAVRDPQRSSSQVEAIMASQLSDEEKLKRADFIVYNDEKNSLIAQANTLLEQISKKQRNEA